VTGQVRIDRSTSSENIWKATTQQDGGKSGKFTSDNVKVFHCI
jgi:hypothetical protein